MGEQFDVVVLGSCIVDFICYVNRIPKIGETLHGTKFVAGKGGKGANQCVSASRLGSKTAIISKLGDDSWGHDYKITLEKEKINTNFVEIVKGQSTGVAQINVADNGDNQIVIVVGANNCLSINDVKQAANILLNSKVLVCQLETPFPATIEALKMFKGISILNAAPAISAGSELPKELLCLPTIFCVNETEAALLTGVNVNDFDEIKTAILLLLSMGCNTVIITLGSRGSVFASKADPHPIHVETKHIENVIDTTGAGDSFIGALANSLSDSNTHLSFQQHVGRACQIASMSIQFPGTQTSFPYLADIDHEIITAYKWKRL